MCICICICILRDTLITLSASCWVKIPATSVKSFWNENNLLENELSVPSSVAMCSVTISICVSNNKLDISPGVTSTHPAVNQPVSHPSSALPPCLSLSHVMWEETQVCNFIAFIRSRLESIVSFVACVLVSSWRREGSEEREGSQGSGSKHFQLITLIEK